MGPAKNSSMRADIASAYLASAVRLGSWLLVYAMVFRILGADAFALLALVRATIGLLNYTSLGLAPAMIHTLAQSQRQSLPIRQVFSSGTAMGLILSLLGLGLTVIYAFAFPHLLDIPGSFAVGDLVALVFLIGLGIIARLVSDTWGAVLQTQGRIALDNFLIVGAEIVWVLLVSIVLNTANRSLVAVGVTFAAASGVLALARFYLASHRIGFPAWSQVDRKITVALLSFGLLVVLAQLADYLYAPTDYILINKLISPAAVADYAPAVQIDAGLLLLVGGLATVLLPKSAIAHAAGDSGSVRRWYLRGTLLSFGLLVVSALVVWIVSPWLFYLWLKNPMEKTQAILPLVLIHTALGGSSAVGRSVLLAIGKVRAFTVSVLIAGVGNVFFSVLFVSVFHWGLKGIILGTIVAVTGRCAVWMPWYVLKTLREEKRVDQIVSAVPME